MQLFCLRWKKLSQEKLQQKESVGRMNYQKVFKSQKIPWKKLEQFIRQNRTTLYIPSPIGLSLTELSEEGWRFTEWGVMDPLTSYTVVSSPPESLTGRNGGSPARVSVWPRDLFYIISDLRSNVQKTKLFTTRTVYQQFKHGRKQKLDLFQVQPELQHF